jgi:hypothetical protein
MAWPICYPKYPDPERVEGDGRRAQWEFIAHAVHVRVTLHIQYFLQDGGVDNKNGWSA